MHILSTQCKLLARACHKQEARALEALLILSRQHVTAETLAQTGAGRRLKKLSKKGGSTRVREAATAAMNMWKERVGWKADSAASSGRGQQSSSEPHTANHGGHAADVGTQQRGVQELRAVTGDIPAALLCHCGSLKKLFTSIHGARSTTHQTCFAALLLGSLFPCFPFAFPACVS